jgi:hypothetical protein
MFAGLENWANDLWWLAGISAVTFVGSIALVPFLAVRIPADYFSTGRRGKTPLARKYPILRLTMLLMKNLLGLVLVMGGFLMLFLPGQGLLTMFLGIMLMDFPGKYRLQRYLISRGPVLKSINWIRKKSGVRELETTEVDIV